MIVLRHWTWIKPSPASSTPTDSRRMSPPRHSDSVEEKKEAWVSEDFVQPGHHTPLAFRRQIMNRLDRECDPVISLRKSRSLDIAKIVLYGKKLLFLPCQALRCHRNHGW